MEALHDLVRPGRCAISGVLDVDMAVRPGPVRGRPERLDPVSCPCRPVQPDHAEEEREMLPFCWIRASGAALEPAGSRPADPGLERNHRAQRDRPVPPHALQPGCRLRSQDRRAVQAIASGAGCVARPGRVAWLLHQPAVTRRFVGVTKLETSPTRSPRPSWRVEDELTGSRSLTCPDSRRLLTAEEVRDSAIHGRA